MSQQPTFHITKEHFVGVINSLHAQFVKDKENTSLLGQIFNTEIPGYYDNSALINSIFSFLHEVFPKDEDGHCEIEFYCYCANFGKVGDSYESPEELYVRLINSQVPSDAKKFTVVGPTFIGGPSNTSVAFLYAEDGAMEAFNANIMSQVRDTRKMMHDGAKKAMDTKIKWDSAQSYDGINQNRYLNDEAGQFPFHNNPSKWHASSKEMLESAERNVNHWRKVVASEASLATTGKMSLEESLNSRPSPDETA